MAAVRSRNLIRITAAKTPLRCARPTRRGFLLHMNESVTRERLMEVLAYNPETGVFIWKKRPTTGAHRIKAGDVAGSMNKGYRIISIDRVRYFTHRLAWLYHYGCWPNGDLDHWDHATDNNAVGNLREGTDTQNLGNQNDAHRDSKSGILGVIWDKNRQKWKTEIQFGRIRKHIGRFDTKEEAQTAYLSAKRQHHEFCTL